MAEMTLGRAMEMIVMVMIITVIMMSMLWTF